MKIKDTEIQVIKGDLTEQTADAIVNAANNIGYMGGGVALAIRRKGGKIIEEEALAKGPMPVGEALVTTGGELNADYVIHAAGMGMDFKTDAKKIYDSTFNTLLRAGELKLKSIAFPSIGTGVGHFPPERSAKVMLEAVKEHCESGTSLKKITFVLYNDENYKSFKSVFSVI